MVVISRSDPRGSTSMSAMSWSRSDGVSVRSWAAGSVASGHGCGLAWATPPATAVTATATTITLFIDILRNRLSLADSIHLSTVDRRLSSVDFLSPPQPSLQRQPFELDEALEPVRAQRERRAQRRSSQNEAQGFALFGVPLQLVGLVTAQEVELGGPVGHGALDRLRHQHVADRKLAIFDVETTQVIVDARAQLKAVERRTRLAVEAQPMQTQPPALHELARHL